MRKFITLFCIFAASVLFIILGIGVFLIVAPGTDFFGIHYISGAPANEAYSKVSRDFVDKDLKIVSGGVPVNVEITSMGGFEFILTQSFNGFTRTPLKKAEINESEDENGNVVITAKEIERFIFGQNTNFQLTVKIPAYYVGNVVVIDSKTSSVSLSTAAHTAAALAELKVKTSGKIKFGGEWTVNNLTIQGTGTSLALNENFNVLNDANITLGTQSCTILNNVGGKLSFSSRGGALNFQSAAELAAETRGGSVTSTSNNVSVSGDATINSGNGRVTLQKVEGDLTVTTRSGAVSIGTNPETRGGVNGKVNITTMNGNITLHGDYLNEEYLAEKQSVVFSQSGNIALGQIGHTEEHKALKGPYITVRNIKVISKRGKIDIENAETLYAQNDSGAVFVESFTKDLKITTTRGIVTVGEGSIGASLEINSNSGNIFASHLNGPTKVQSGGKIELTFDSIGGKIDIVGKDREIKAIIPDSVDANTYFFNIKSTKTNLAVHITGHELTNGKEFNNAQNILSSQEARLIQITSGSGKIKLLNSSNSSK